MSEQQLIFAAMVFAAVFMLILGMTMPVFGESKQAQKRLQKRLNELAGVTKGSEITTLLRKKYLKSLSPFERRLETLPGMESLGQQLEEAGYEMRAYKAVLYVEFIAVLATIGAWMLTRVWWMAAIVGLITLLIPYFKLQYARHQRIAKFEEQLPEAIDIMRRAVQAGHPFAEAIHLVGDEMTGPVGKEFQITFADLNYGNDLRRAMLGLLQRVPSVTVMALVTSVLIQKDTGGNLAEILDQISRVIRSRFKFQRKVKTLSAEGRLSGWILCMVPFVLVIMLSIMQPDYLTMLIDNPTGMKLIAFAFVGMMIGVYWIRKIIRIQV